MVASDEFDLLCIYTIDQHTTNFSCFSSEMDLMYETSVGFKLRNI
jgi:hypothetical protein